MAVSGSSNYNLTTNEIIDEAFSIAGIASEGRAITADMYARGNRSLNLLIKTWGANERLWTKTERSVTLIASTASYALTPKPMRVMSVRRRKTSGSIDTTMTEMSREEYYDQPNKTIDSVPTSFYYDPQTTTGTLYVWPRPSTAIATDYTLQLTYLRRMDDMDGTADDADMPQEWLQALCYALASELALKYGVAPDVRAEIGARATLLYEALSGWDNEPASIFIQPDMRWC